VIDITAELVGALVREQRARGWALWKSLITLAGQSGPGPDDEQTRLLTQILEC
jgi:hypothetical protein